MTTADFMTEMTNPSIYYDAPPDGVAPTGKRMIINLARSPTLLFSSSRRRRRMRQSAYCNNRTASLLFLDSVAEEEEEIHAPALSLPPCFNMTYDNPFCAPSIGVDGSNSNNYDSREDFPTTTFRGGSDKNKVVNDEVFEVSVISSLSSMSHDLIRQKLIVNNVVVAPQQQEERSPTPPPKEILLVSVLSPSLRQQQHTPLPIQYQEDVPEWLRKNRDDDDDTTICSVTSSSSIREKNCFDSNNENLPTGYFI